MKRFIQAYIRFVQRILIGILLPMFYFLGFGLIRAGSMIFRRQWHRHPSLPGGDRGGSYWLAANDYGGDVESCQHQS